MYSFSKRVVSQTQEGGENEGSKRVTVPQPFNITQSKPKKQKEEEAPPEPFKPQPVPETIYTTTLKEIEKEKEKIREKVKKETKDKYAKGPGTFKFKTDERPMKKEKLIKEAEETEKKLLQFNKKYYEPPLTYKEIEAEVKFNAAAILREDFILQKKKAEEEKRLKSYEVDLHNSGEFDQWQKEMKERDAILQTEQMQKRKLEMQMARNEAIASCKKKLKENQILVQKMKVESELGAREREAKIQEELNRKQELRDLILESKDNAAIEKEKVLLKNQQIREEVEREIEDALKRKKEEEMIEKQRRDEMIRKIRELERKPIERKTEYDPTETSGLGLLEEMSLAELRIRLESLKKQRIEEEERNRQENMKKKEEYTKMILEKTERIAAERDKKARDKERLREEKKQREERKRKQEQEARERGLCIVQEKIAEKKREKRKEEDRLAKELKEIRLQRQYLNEDKAKIEEKAWKRLEIGAERQTKITQNQKLIDQYAVETVNLKETKLKAKAAKELVMSKVQRNAAYDAEYERKVRENETLHKQDLLAKEKKYKRQKEFESELKTKTIDRNPYSTKVTKKASQMTKKTMKETISPHIDQTNELDLIEQPNDKINDIDNKLKNE